MKISIETGSYLDFSADLLVCKKGGAIMQEMAPYIMFERYVSPSWPRSKGGYKQKLSLYISDHPKYKKILAVSYSPKSNDPAAFSPNNSPHGCNIFHILYNGLLSLILSDEIRSIVITALSWRNPNINDCVMASLLKEFCFLKNNFKASINFVSLEPRPILNELYGSGYSIWEEYLSKLTRYYGIKT